MSKNGNPQYLLVYCLTAKAGRKKILWLNKRIFSHVANYFNQSQHRLHTGMTKFENKGLIYEHRGITGTF